MLGGRKGKFGDQCNSDFKCDQEMGLVCGETCRCKEGEFFNPITNRCEKALKINDHYYYLSRFKTDWSTANETCIKNGYKLFQFYDSEELHQVLEYFELDTRDLSWV